MNALFKQVDATIQRVLFLVTIVLFVVLATLLFSNILLRLVNDFSMFLGRHGMEGAAATVKAIMPVASLHWIDEIVELCFAALVFYGAAALWGRHGHFSVGDWISSRLPNAPCRALYKLIVTLTSASFIAVLFYYSLRLTLRSTELSTVFQIPKSVMYSCMPISSAIMLGYSLVDVYNDLMCMFTGEPDSCDHVAEQ